MTVELPQSLFCEPGFHGSVVFNLILYRAFCVSIILRDIILVPRGLYGDFSLLVRFE